MDIFLNWKVQFLVRIQNLIWAQVFLKVPDSVSKQKLKLKLQIRA